MQKGNHIYTLNHDIHSLQQRRHHDDSEQEAVFHELLIFPLSAASSSADVRIAQSTQDVLNIIQDIKTYICASELEQQQPVQITEVFVMQNNYEQLFLDLQNCGLCIDTTYHEVMANKQIRIKFSGRSESTRYQVEDDKEARYYRMIETIDDIVIVAQDMATYKLVVELQRIFLGGEPLEKDLSCCLILKDNDQTNFLFQLMDA